MTLTRTPCSGRLVATRRCFRSLPPAAAARAPPLPHPPQPSHVHRSPPPHCSHPHIRYTKGGWQGHVHTAVMQLQHGVTYSYRVGDRSGGWSDVFTYTALPADIGCETRPLRLLQVADMAYDQASDHTVRSSLPCSRERAHVSLRCRWLRCRRKWTLVSSTSCSTPATSPMSALLSHAVHHAAWCAAAMHLTPPQADGDMPHWDAFLTKVQVPVPPPLRVLHCVCLSHAHISTSRALCPTW